MGFSALFPLDTQFNDACEELILGNTNVNGFPIIASDNNRIIMGYIGSTELRHVLGEFHHLIIVSADLIECTDKSSKLENVSPDTICSFSPESEAHDDSRLSDLAAGPALGVDDGISTALFASTTIHDRILFWPWVNRVRVSLMNWLVFII